MDSLVSKLLHDNQSNIKLKSLGFNDRYVFELGDRNYLHKINKMDKDSITSAVRDFCGKRQN